MLKRHLKTAYDMTPEQYRERWNLAPDYPMVAPNYAQHRSTLAKQIGLGTKPRA
jgi:predicted transcriptional regulator